jgi:tripartite-type tricarboxylate transporter receptor subunit TctC
MLGQSKITAAYTWYALYGPAGTPKNVVDLLGGAIEKITERGDFKNRVEQSGATICYMGPDELTAHTKQEVAHWTAVIRKLGIPVQTQ